MRIADIVRGVSAFYGMAPEAVRGKGRAREVVRARTVSYYLCRELTGRSYPVIAWYFSGRHHTTPLACVANVRRRMTWDEGLRREVETVSARIEGRVRG